MLPDTLIFESPKEPFAAALLLRISRGEVLLES